MTAASLLAAVAAALALPSVRACGFARRGGALPAGHAGISCPNQAPGVPYLDGAVGEAHAWPDLPYADFYIARAIANLSTSYATPLCYVSQQVLPSPPTGTDPASGNCTWPATAADAADVAAMYALGTQATTRMRAMQRGGPAFLGSTCGGGASNVRALCAADPAGEKCVPALLAQRSAWAVASNVVRIDAATLPAVVANDTAWRGSAAWHVPAMTSAQVAAGWGTGGGISFKVVPCADVPPALVGAAFDCDALDAATGRPVWDEAFAWWAAYAAPAWLREGVRAAVAARREGGAPRAAAG